MNRIKHWENSYPQTLKNYQIDENTLMESLGELTKSSASRFKQNTAFSVVLPNGSSQQLNYEQIDQYSDVFANYLKQQLQLQPGDVVAIQLPNSLHYPIAVFGIWKAGLIVTNINPLYNAHELKQQLQDSAAKVLIACDSFLHTALNVVIELDIELVVTRLNDFFPIQINLLMQMKLSHELESARFSYPTFMHTLQLGQKTLQSFTASHYPIALYQYTDGTTGKSKAAIVTHANLSAMIKMVEDMMQTFTGAVKWVEGDVVLTALPMYHIFSFNFNFLLFFKCGAHNVLVSNPYPLENLEKVFKQFEVNWMTGGETLYAGLLQQKWFLEHPSALKLAISGGSSLRPSTLEVWRKYVSHIIEGYGMTESSCFVSFIPPTALQRIGTVGIPLPGLDVRLINEQGRPAQLNEAGELWVKGPNIIQSYLNNPEETIASIQDGWFRTGDIVSMDAEGFLRIIDRKKDLILVSGFNVFPNEIEDILSQHPDVMEAAVIGIMDEHTGEAVKAFVIAKNDSIKAQDMINFCKQRLPPYKVPKYIEFRKELPKSAVGKILRAKLRSTKSNEVI